MTRKIVLSRHLHVVGNPFPARNWGIKSQGSEEATNMLIVTASAGEYLVIHVAETNE